MIDNKILIELLKSYIESKDVSIRDILEAVNNRAEYYFDDITKDIVLKYSEIIEKTSEQEEVEENENETATKQDDANIKANEECPDIEIVKSVKEEEKTENVKIPKPNLKIISNFYACDRLDELDEVPKLEDGNVDYWQASKLLCEKDGGRLPTMKELAEIASYMYQTKIGEFEDNYDLELKNELIPLGYYWSSLEASSTYAYYRIFYSDSSRWYRGYGRSNAYRALCVGD